MHTNWDTYTYTHIHLYTHKHAQNADAHTQHHTHSQFPTYLLNFSTQEPPKVTEGYQVGRDISGDGLLRKQCSY